MYKRQVWDCAWLQNGGVDLARDIDGAQYAADHSDPRIKAVAAIDPALAQAYSSESIAAIDMPVQLLNLGDTPQGVDSFAFGADFPQGHIHVVEDAIHFSFLAECTRMGPLVISASGEEPICTDLGTRSRGDIHSEIAAQIGTFFVENL